MNVSNEFKGTYIHPKLVHFVAKWVDLEYAFTASDIMYKISVKIREELKNQQLPDIVENSKLIKNYIAIWASPNYDIYVGDIMDQINDKVREELNKQQLPDTVENSKPIVNEIVKSIAPNIHINNSST